MLSRPGDQAECGSETVQLVRLRFYDYIFFRKVGALPDPKDDRSSFVMISEAVSNVACRVSQHGPGAELDGGIHVPTPPPARCT